MYHPAMAQISQPESKPLADHKAQRSLADLLLRLAGISGILFTAAYIAGRVYLGAYLYVFGLSMAMVDANPFDVAFRPIQNLYWLFMPALGAIVVNIWASQRYPDVMESVRQDQGSFPELRFSANTWRNKGSLIIGTVYLTEFVIVLVGAGYDSLSQCARIGGMIMVISVGGIAVGILVSALSLANSWQRQFTYATATMIAAIFVTPLTMGLLLGNIDRSDDFGVKQWAITIRRTDNPDHSLTSVRLLGRNDHFLAIWDFQAQKTMLIPVSEVVALERSP